MSRAEGVWGEAQIANYLRRRRYELLAHSYHCRFGEIDLIARKGGVLCFVEVKTRSNLACGLPREYVTAAKQERIRKTYETERAAAEMTRLLKETELKKQQVEIERERLNVEVREKANAEKDARIARAEAERFERQAKADAELYESQKAAEAIEMKGRAEAEAIRRKAEAMQLYGQAAMLEMVVDKLPEVARAIGEPLGQTDKIILFGEGAATGLTRDVTGSMLQSFEAIKAATNLDIPGLLNKVASGGLVGRHVPDAETAEPAEAPAEPQTESEE